MKLSIIVLNYKTADLTINCIKSLRENYKKELESKNIEIVVVDNASDDDSVAKINDFTKDKEGIVFLESSDNLGFSGGCNYAAAKTKGNYLFFLNSDTNVLDKGILGMVDLMEKENFIGILGGALQDSDGSPQPSAGAFYSPWNLLIMLLGGQRLGFLKKSPKVIEKVDWVSGASLMVRKDLFEKLKGFDEEYFMYVEDMDLCFRAKKAGFSTYFFPKVKIKHMGEASSNRSFAVSNIYKNLLLFYKKQMGELNYRFAYFCLFLKAILIYTIGRLVRNSYYTEAYGQALKLFR
jgi:GT2 family glycosyltransferase